MSYEHWGASWKLRGYDLFCGDAWDLEVVDPQVAITDPPYSEAVHRAGARARSDERLDFEPLPIPDIVELLLFEVERWAIAFCALEDLGAYREAAEARGAFFRPGIWRKTDPAPQLNGRGPSVGAEGIAIMHPRGMSPHNRKHPAIRWNGGGRAAVWDFPTVRTERGERIHSTQKPVALIAELVSLFSDPVETVWDPFMGSGTTAIACARLGRAFVGHEINRNYYVKACRRVRDELRYLDGRIVT